MPRIGIIVWASFVIIGLLPGVARSAPSLTTLYSFAGGGDGGRPVAALISYDSMLYGTTPNINGTHCFPQCGTVFKLDPTTGVKTLLHTFRGRADGSDPEAALIQVDGRLYGTTAGGGPDGQGTLFEINPGAGSEVILHSFSGGTDGAVPLASLFYTHGTFYGTTSEGGAGACGSPGCGTIFTFDRKSGAEAIVYVFQGGADGVSPASPLLSMGSMLYGTTQQGGGDSACATGCGTVFQVNATTGAEVVLHAFLGGADGAAPRGPMAGLGTTIYGDTVLGGRSGAGTVFGVDVTTGRETVIASLSGAHGAYSESGLILVQHGIQPLLYGAASSGGDAGAGTLFVVNVSSGTQTAIYNLSGGADGTTPAASLYHTGSAFYGTTSAGAAGGFGTVFVLK